MSTFVYIQQNALEADDTENSAAVLVNDIVATFRCLVWSPVASAIEKERF